VCPGLTAVAAEQQTWPLEAYICTLGSPKPPAVRSLPHSNAPSPFSYKTTADYKLPLASADTHRHTIDESSPGVTSVLAKTHEHAVLDHGADADERVLGALGYKQEFKRDFSIWSCFGISFCELGVLPSIASSLTFNLAYSGPAGSVWGWLVASTLVQFVALSMAEVSPGWAQLALSL